MKNKVRNYFIVALILIMGALGIYQGVSTKKQTGLGCSFPILYTIGRVDADANMSKAQFQSAVAEAEKRWEDTLREDVFVAASSGATISFINDGRGARLAILWQAVTEKQEKYSIAKAKYDASVKRGDSLDLQSRLYQDSYALYEQYRAAYDNVINQTAEDASLAQGLYDPKSKNLNIYYFEDRNDLIYTIMHEMGHMLGLGHTQVSDSVMNIDRTTGDSRPNMPSKENAAKLRELCAMNK